MKSILTLLLATLASFGFAQQSDSTSMRSRNIRDGFIENYTALKADKNVKNGFAEILFLERKIASGQYKNNTRTGQWKFYLLNGEIDQIYNYTTKRVEFETKNNSSSFKIDNSNPGDEVIPPVKIGGTYAGILVMSKITARMLDFRSKKGSYEVNYIYQLDKQGVVKQIELKVSGPDYNQSQYIDLQLFKPQELDFLPAMVNKTPISSTFTINTKIISN
ncbi:hypothetical protein [Pedobacter aquatilis]|uniref:hypothetical protein n=1 Tax=Pedobacter aquatilis TaxID=351343 RepID=UPI00292E46ED|nr:hypothetical protein [Pedobacter aquatilis]